MPKPSLYSVVRARVEQYLENSGFHLWLESEDGHFGLLVPAGCCSWKDDHPEIGPIRGEPDTIMGQLKQELLPD